MARSVFHRTKTGPGAWVQATGAPPFDITGLNNGTIYEVDDGNGIAEYTPVGSGFAGGNVSEADLYDAGVLMATGSAIGPTAGGTLTVNSVSLGSYDYSIHDAHTISAFSNGNYFTTTADSRAAFVIVKGNLTINSGQTLIPSNRKLFTVLFVDGNLAVAGDISMTGRGANHSTATGSNVSAAAIRVITGTHGGVTDPQIPAAGGAGGVGISGIPTTAGTAGTSGGTGGGGSGGGISALGGNGAAGTGFSGGPGGGGTTGEASAAGDAADIDGGIGGDGVSNNGGRAAGGGAGNPGGAGDSATATGENGGNGTGGVLVIICTGAFSGAGTITAAGLAGGGATGVAADRASGGGGSGGGSVTILYGTDTSSITPTAAGGAGGVPTGGTVNRDGGAGGAGTARKLQKTA